MLSSHLRMESEGAYGLPRWDAWRARRPQTASGLTSKIGGVTPDGRRGPLLQILDANSIVACIFPDERRHHAAWELLDGLTEDVRAGGPPLVVSPRWLAEVIRTCSRLLYDREHGPTSFTALSPDARTEALVSYSQPLRDTAAKLLADGAPHLIAPVLPDDRAVAAEVATSRGLGLPDALQVVMARRLCEGRIVTNDRHMRSLPDVTASPTASRPRSPHEGPRSLRGELPAVAPGARPAGARLVLR